MTAIPDRIGRLQETWRRGGQGGNAPFQSAPGSRYGYDVNPNAAPTSQLFQPRTGIRGQINATDVAVMGGLGTEGAVAEARRMAADHELAEANAAASRDPSDVNIARLQQAKDEVAFWQSLARVGQAGAVSYGVTATKTPRVYPRPDLSRADAELARLNQRLAPPAPPPPPPPPPPPQRAPRQRWPAGDPQRRGGRFKSE
jgi:hypothetical protein